MSHLSLNNVAVILVILRIGWLVAAFHSNERRGEVGRSTIQNPGTPACLGFPTVSTPARIYSNRPQMSVVYNVSSSSDCSPCDTLPISVPRFPKDPFIIEMGELQARLKAAVLPDFRTLQAHS